MSNTFPDLPTIEEPFDESPSDIIDSEPPADEAHAHLTLTQYAHKLAQDLKADIDRQIAAAEARGNHDLADALRRIR